MDTTFITIHDLSIDARILYSSDSIVDILGHTPDEVINRSCWDFFHPDEIPLAKELHNRGVKLDKAAVLAYCQLKNRQDQWIGCECCFTVVYDVMVVCTSIYRQGLNSQRRAAEAPIVRRLFSSSPEDPRYHMLSHLSTKFSQGPKEQTHEPRAALFLNRFTRTLTIMYATTGIEQILGIPGEHMKGRSFYYCIQENCLEDAVRCLEGAKSNDSIAYMRFWFRDPRFDDQATAPQDTPSEDDAVQTDESMTDITTSEDEDEGGVQLQSRGQSGSNERTSHDASHLSMDLDGLRPPDASFPSRTSSGDSTYPTHTHAAIFGEARPTRSSVSSAATSPESTGTPDGGPIELEAVVSCTSDGLVVCLRRARPMPPSSAHSAQPEQQRQAYVNGLFAAPWAPQPMFVPPRELPRENFGQAMAPSYSPRAPAARPVGPAQEDFMSSIRDAAIFAWALTGLNGNLAEYARGKPTGESQPPGGFPVWSEEPNNNGNHCHQHQAYHGQQAEGYQNDDHYNAFMRRPTSSSGPPITVSARTDPFGDPGLDGHRHNGRHSSGGGNGHGNNGMRWS
ncbi:hypothetical protein LTS18_007861 [Coniosporium uncinatum]|uniref:Uncharacterized protein n=1 Tax=Coniosporium uncinatum TaxID=93489 RepID=A0ACC3E087_9PEZI|nr:hypothetical protein LTS18_007861 [Coniosporium uncinatum]